MSEKFRAEIKLILANVYVIMAEERGENDTYVLILKNFINNIQSYSVIELVKHLVRLQDNFRDTTDPGKALQYLNEAIELLIQQDE